LKLRLSLLTLGLGAAVFASAQTTVYSNNPIPGDYFSNAGTNLAWQDVNSFSGPSGERWIYRNVRNNGTVGINTELPRNGNGSVWFSTDGTANSQSEIAMSTSFSNGSSTGSLGLFDQLSAWAADVYTVSGGTANMAPILRLELYSATDINANTGTAGVYGQLVFDTTWNPSTAPTITYGQWHNLDLFGNAGTTYLRATSALNATHGPGGIGERTLSDWMSILAGRDYNILSVNAGIGSTSLMYSGALDNYTFGVGGVNTTYNFEAVPEPGTMLALGAGAVGLLIRRRRQAKR
jgi:hypothetical protein